MERTKKLKTIPKQLPTKNGIKSIKQKEQIKNPYDMLFDKHCPKTITFHNKQPTSNDNKPSFFPPPTLQHSSLLSNLNEAFDKIEGIIHYLTLPEKIEAFIQLVQNSTYSQSTRLGGLIAIYLLTSRIINDEHSDESVPSILPSINNLCIYILINFKNFSELFLICALDTLSLINDIEFLIPNINLISLFLTDNNYPQLQSSAFHCLFRIGHPGITALIEICKTYPRYQQLILTKLIHTPHIQHIIVVRSLLNELYSKDVKRIHNALYALNRLYWVVSGEDNIEFAICELFNDHRLDKTLIASTLRTSGELGEKMLLGLAKTHSDFSVRSAICKVLGVQIGSPRYLKIVIDFNRNEYIKGRNNYVAYRYYGKECCVCSEEFQRGECSCSDKESCTCQDSYIEVYSEEVLAALNRMIQLDYKHINAYIDYNKNTLSSIFSVDLLCVQQANHLHPLNLHIVELTPKTKQIPEETQSQLNEVTQANQMNAIINVLYQCLKDKQPSVRISAINAIRNIGYLYSQQSYQHLLALLNKEKDTNIISSTLNALSSLQYSPHQLPQLQSIITTYLTHPNTQIQLTALNLIPHIKNNCPDNILSILHRNLLSREVNKLAYVKALLHAGYSGENILISLFDKNDYKLQANIAQGFAYADPFSSNIDFIIETLLKHQNCNSALVRKNIILTLSSLSKYDNISTILCNKNILDIYYKKLCDFDEQIGLICLNNLIAFGAKGELLLIQGALHDKNTKTRLLCGKGLVKMGVHNFNTLLIVLIKEKDENVRDELCEMILRKYDVKEVARFCKTSRRDEAIVINIEEVLKGNKVKEDMKRYLTEVKKEVGVIVK